MRIRFIFAAMALAAGALAMGCERDKPSIQSYDTPKGSVSIMRPADSHAGMTMPPMTAGPAAEGELAEYRLPDDWTLDPTPRAMRELTANVGQGTATAVFVISRLDSSAYTNDPLANINRWRAMVDASTLTQASDQPVARVAIGGETGSCLDIAGNSGQRLILAMSTRGSEIWFFRLTGDAAVVEREKANFEAFLSSVKFSPE
jgi:hypothetical protein